jgi:multiple sugar transport system substrate-binding protein
MAPGVSAASRSAAAKERAAGGVRRRRLLGGIPALGATGAVLAACAPGGGGADRIAQGKSSREVTIRWSTWGDDKNTFNTDAAPKGVKVFGEMFPKVKVVIEPQVGASEVWGQKNLTEWLAGTGPDLSGHCCTVGVQWARDGLFLDLNERIRRDIPDRIRQDYVEWLMKLFNQPGAGQFGLPMYSGTIGLFYNKVLFQRKGVAPPDDTWDWNKYREAAIKLNDPAAGVFGRRRINGIDRIAQRIHQAGGNWFDPNDGSRAFFDRPEAMQALQYERDANLKDRYTAFEGQFNATSGMDLWQAHSAQKFAMWEEGSWTLVRMVTQVEKDVVPQWDVAPLPKGPRQRDTLATHDGWAIWKGSKVADEAWELLKFLQSDQWLDINVPITGQQPARKSFQDRWMKALKDSNPQLASKNLKPFTDAINQNYARPKEFLRKRQADAEAIINTMLNEAVYVAETAPAIKNGEKALDAAVRDAASQVNELQK